MSSCFDPTEIHISSLIKQIIHKWTKNINTFMRAIFFKTHFNMLQNCQLLFCYLVNNKNVPTRRLCNAHHKTTIADSLECLQVALQISAFPRTSSKICSHNTPGVCIKQPQICLLWLLWQKNLPLAVHEAFKTCSGLHTWICFLLFYLKTVG